MHFNSQSLYFIMMFGAHMACVLQYLLFRMGNLARSVAKTDTPKQTHPSIKQIKTKTYLYISRYNIWKGEHATPIATVREWEYDGTMTQIFSAPTLASLIIKAKCSRYAYRVIPVPCCTPDCLTATTQCTHHVQSQVCAACTPISALSRFVRTLCCFTPPMRQMVRAFLSLLLLKHLKDDHLNSNKLIPH